MAANQRSSGTIYYPRLSITSIAHAPVGRMFTFLKLSHDIYEDGWAKAGPPTSITTVVNYCHRAVVSDGG